MTYSGADISACFDSIDVDMVVVRTRRAELSAVDAHGRVPTTLRALEG